MLCPNGLMCILCLKSQHFSCCPSPQYAYTRVLDYCRMWHSRMNVPVVLRAVERSYLWDSFVYLLMQTDEWDKAAQAMMDHSPSAFSADEFLDVISRVGALAVMYRALDFYIGEEPERLEDLLNILGPRVDCGRAVEMLRRARRDEFGELGCLPFAIKFMSKMQRTQGQDVGVLNEAINAVHIASGDAEKLRESVDNHRDIDTLRLAVLLENHVFIEMRRISGSLWGRSGKYERAIKVAERNLLYADMINTIAVSKDMELAEVYAGWFIERDLRECFVALLFACYEFFPPDLVLELGWGGRWSAENCLRSFVMPFLIQTIAEAGRRLGGLEAERADAKEIEAKARAETEKDVSEDVSVLLYGLAPSHQVPMVEYRQAGGSGVGGIDGGYGVGEAVRGPLMIGWGGGGVIAPNPTDMYSTFVGIGGVSGW
jgi:clathrin heavy chain